MLAALFGVLVRILIIWFFIVFWLFVFCKSDFEFSQRKFFFCLRFGFILWLVLTSVVDCYIFYFVFCIFDSFGRDLLFGLICSFPITHFVSWWQGVLTTSQKKNCPRVFSHHFPTSANNQKKLQTTFKILSTKQKSYLSLRLVWLSSQQTTKRSQSQPPQ
eukprot:c11121_g2_i1.p1 GENE.c11121_g2_i1~~c11121_g2_i1.p1  ORF type:complete len:160 (+),score=17.23 c11121_g2_i1:302-781(+)